MNLAFSSRSTAAMSCSILRASTGEDTPKATHVHTAMVPARSERAERTGSGLHVRVELRCRQRALEVAEASVAVDLASCVDEPAHRRAVERSRQADPPHACGLELAHRERFPLDPCHEVHRLL